MGADENSRFKLGAVSYGRLRKTTHPIRAHITGDIEQAREVVQDTFLKLCRQKPAQIRNYLAQWLYTVCRNRALDVLRKRDA